MYVCTGQQSSLGQQSPLVIGGGAMGRGIGTVQSSTGQSAFGRNPSFGSTATFGSPPSIGTAPAVSVQR